jgi:hypothetical protein
MIFARFISSLLFFLVVGSVSAAVLPVENYPNARVVFESNAKTDEYVLGLGRYTKTGGSWRADRQQRLSGNLTRYTLELPAGHNANAGFGFYLEQLQNFNIRELFHCAGRSCGTSNSWANNHFKIQLLYGLDQFQQYGAYEVITADAKPFYVALYAVQRGNKRVYLQLDVLHVDKVIALGLASSSESIIKSLDVNGYYVFPDMVIDDAKSGASIQIKPAHLQALVDVLTELTDLSVALVGHDYAGASLAQQLKDSERYAQQLKVALQEKGVAPALLTTHGVGSLAPAGRGDRSARVEVVKTSN